MLQLYPKYREPFQIAGAVWRALYGNSGTGHDYQRFVRIVIEAIEFSLDMQTASELATRMNKLRWKQNR